MYLGSVNKILIPIPATECILLLQIFSGSVLKLGISREGEGNGTPLQHSCLENPMDGGAWRAPVHGIAEGRT